MAFYISIFAILAVVLVVGVLVVLVPRRRKEMRSMEGEMHTGTGHTRAPVPVHPARQKHVEGLKEPAPSGGVFRKEGLGSKVKQLFHGGASDQTWKELEDLLLKADIGPAASADLVARVKADYKSGANPTTLIHQEILAVLGPDQPLEMQAGLNVVLVVGVNGAGKTTTIGKLSKRLGHEGLQVSLAASDTFRAAAGEQLEIWAERTGAHLVQQERGADPGAVAFDAVKAASARGSDVLLVDTAGRLHTKQPLMDELGKVKRVIEKAGAEIAETLLVLDAQTGQNGIAQARAFTEAVTVTGVVLTKTDGSAKGGVVLAVREELGVPIRFVGVGEGADDLRPFEAEAFADRLLSG
jgi:fused signal recognition particle receptor